MFGWDRDKDDDTDTTCTNYDILNLALAAMATVHLLLLVDSSLTVAQEWKRILVDYIQPFLARLSDGSKIQTAFVSYATADSNPSPLLARLPFSDPTLLFSECKSDPKNLGIGRTAETKSLRMAALEGMVAALELFDDIPPKPEGTRTVNRLIHISASPSDDAKHPRRNSSTQLDQTTWSGLPAEFKKRNIIMSGICLNDLPSFIELYKSVSTESQQPWFPVNPGHHIFLSGFPPPSVKSLKRSPETQTSPDAKRTKTVENKTVETKPVETPTALPETPIQSPPKQTVSEPSPAQPTPPAPTSQAQAMGRAQNFVRQIQALNAGISKVEEQIPAVRASGDTAKANRMETEVMKLKEHRAKLMSILGQLRNMLASGQPPSGLLELVNSGQPSSSASSSSTSSAPAPPPVPPASPPKPSTAAQPSAPAPSAATSIAQVAHQGSEAIHAQQNQIAAQLQRLNQQRAAASHAPPPPANTSVLMGAKPTPQRPPIWQGALAFTVPDPSTQSIKQTQAHVSVIPQGPNNVELNTESWPPVIHIAASLKTFNNSQEILSMVKRPGIVLCALLPQGENDHAFTLLHRLLVAKKTLATGGWTAPSGAQKNNVIVFPLGTHLAAAFSNPNGPSPSNAPPPVPVSVPTPQEMPQIDWNTLVASGKVPPHLLARMEALPPDQRMVYLYAQMRQQQQQQQQQRQQQQQHAMAMAASGMGQGGVPPNLGGGVSLEMLQSFMQRRPPGTG